MKRLTASIFFLLWVGTLIYSWGAYFGRELDTSDPCAGKTECEHAGRKISLAGAVVNFARDGVVSLRATSLEPSVRTVSTPGMASSIVFELRNIDTEKTFFSGNIPGVRPLKHGGVSFDAPAGTDISVAFKRTIDGSAKKFIVFGDTEWVDNPFTNARGSYFVFQHVIREINRRRPLCVIIAGDLTGSGRYTSYRRYVKLLDSIHVPVFPAIGNHDTEHDGRSLFRAAFGEWDTTIIFNGMDFILLDDARQTVTNEQLNWLAGAIERGRGLNLFAFYHIPLVEPDPVNGPHDEGDVLRDRDAAAKAVDIMKKGGVKTTFSAHFEGYGSLTTGGINHYIAGGGGGGKDRSNPRGFYHIVEVDASGTEPKVEVVRLSSLPTATDLMPWVAFAILALGLPAAIYLLLRSGSPSPKASS